MTKQFNEPQLLPQTGLQEQKHSMGEIKVEEIHKEVSKYVNDDVSYIDALVYYAQKHDIEVELLGEMIRRSSILKSKVRDDAEKLNMVEHSQKLPL